MMLKKIQHIPVMMNEVLEYINVINDTLIVDATFGSGNFSRKFLEKGANVIGIDRDPDAISFAYPLLNDFPEKFKIFKMDFSNLENAVKQKVDFVIFDIGVSSMQIDDPKRGFSFLRDGPLDMRMSKKGLTAADVVNRETENNLQKIFFLLGEERYSLRIAKMIVKRRRKKIFSNTKDLAKEIWNIIPHNYNIHPATRVFQALRIYINDELGEIARALSSAEKILKPNGKLLVITFHSLEDRIVKDFFKTRFRHISPSRYLPDIPRYEKSFLPLFIGCKKPSFQEILYNPRSRSAKLRAGIRTESEMHPFDPLLFKKSTFISSSKIIK